MPENVTLTDAQLDEIEARAKDMRYNHLPSDAFDILNLIAALRESRERERLYQKALRDMTNPHGNVSGGAYGEGWADGHRCAAGLARAALGEQEAT